VMADFDSLIYMSKKHMFISAFLSKDVSLQTLKEL
jgi:hypothetical protein